MKTLSKKLMAATTLTLGLNGMAFAKDLSTPTLFTSGGRNVCVATNVGNTPVAVTVKLVTLVSGVLQNTCTLLPDDPSGCQQAATDTAYCQVSVLQGSQKNVRVVMINQTVSPPFTMNATVEGR
jgi:hypothetical protein